MFAFDTSKARMSTYALSRFRDVEATGGTFSRREDFEPRSYAERAFGITGGQPPMKVRLLFEPKLAVYLTERQWHSTQQFQRQNDGRVMMTFETTGWKELVRWVLSWMPDVRVLAPMKLRKRIREKLSDGLQAQNSDAGEESTDNAKLG